MSAGRQAGSPKPQAHETLQCKQFNARNVNARAFQDAYAATGAVPAVWAAAADNAFIYFYGNTRDPRISWVILEYKITSTAGIDEAARTCSSPD